MKMMQYYVIQEDDAILHHTKLLSPNHYFSDTYDKYHQNSDKARSQIKGGFSLKNLHFRAHKWGTSDFLYKPSCLWLNLSVCDWPLDGTHLC